MTEAATTATPAMLGVHDVSMRTGIPTDHIRRKLKTGDQRLRTLFAKVSGHWLTTPERVEQIAACFRG